MANPKFNSLKGAKEISLGLIGLDDERTVHIARKLLEKGRVDPGVG